MFNPLDALSQNNIKADILFLQPERIVHQFSGSISWKFYKKEKYVWSSPLTTEAKYLKVSQPPCPAGQLPCLQLILGVKFSPRFMDENLPSHPIQMNYQNGYSFIIWNLFKVRLQEIPLLFGEASSWSLSLGVHNVFIKVRP